MAAKPVCLRSACHTLQNIRRNKCVTLVVGTRHLAEQYEYILFWGWLSKLLVCRRSLFAAGLGCAAVVGEDMSGQKCRLCG